MDKVFGASKGKNQVFGLVCALLWGALVLLNLAVPDASFSQAENRTLASFPAYTTKRLLDGEFMNDMNTYLNDQFVGRPVWVGGQSLAEYGLGKREINGVYIAGGRLLRDYSAENETVSQANLDGVNAFAQDYGMPTSIMLVPSSTYLYRQQLPLWATTWDEGAYIQEVYSQTGEGVRAIDITQELEAAKDGYIFYRTDHHWTSEGARIGYQAFAQSSGLPVRDDEMETTTVSTDFLGTNHSRVGFPFVEADVMEQYEAGRVTGYETYGMVSGGTEYVTTEYDSIFFPEYLEQKDKYTYFLGALQPYVTIHTGAGTCKRLLIFKDSYAHCLAPMLLEDYSEIRLVDLRSFRTDDYNDFVQIDRYDEALFLYSVDTFSQQLGPARLAG